MIAPREDISFDKILSAALQDPEISQAIASSDATEEFFRRQIEGGAAKIWSSASSELETLAATEAELQRLQKDLDGSAPAQSVLLTAFDSVRGAVRGAIWIAVPGLVISGYVSGFKNFGARLLTSPWPRIWGTVLVALLVGMLLRTVLRLRYTRTRDEYIKRSDIGQRISELRETIPKMRSVAEETLREVGIKSELRGLINAETQPNYSLNLGVRVAPGLAEVFDAAYEIPTGSKKKVLRMLEEMPGGSIGIAGPRGAGKSTLIWSLCRGAVPELKGRPLFPIMTSAPVKYDGREFILHLFASLCSVVLGRTSGDDFQQSASIVSHQTLGAYGQNRWQIANRVAVTLLVVGTMLIAVGTIIGFQLAKAPKLNQDNKTAPPITSSSQSRTSSAVGWPELLKASEVKPAPFLLLGVGCSAAGFIGIAAAARGRKTIRDPTEALPGVNERAIQRVGRDIATKAWNLIRELRFQQSYSSGWSGSLKVPVGLEGSINAAVSLAERQRSLPEIVDAYRSFVKLLAANNAVLVGIDELDKLESDEAAQQFLNEIKSIFGLDHCYYLISVSENAISSFERRGLPFRDAFDSAFDTIISVDYLTLENAKRLLKRRVIGLEVPFMCLCYCLSGGLARDLIRSCRDLIERVGSASDPTDLGSICEQMVTNDARAKFRAIEVSLMRYRVEPDLSRAVDNLRNLEDAAFDRATFLSAIWRHPPPSFAPDAAIDSTTELNRNKRAVADLALELHTYLYFAATLLEFFNNSLSEPRLITAEETGEITSLARAKQSFAVNAYTALTILDKFRARNGLAVP